MKTKRTLSLLMAILMTIGTVLSTMAVFAVSASAAEPAHGYVTDGLVALYDGKNHGSSDQVWEDSIGDHDLTINKNDKNYFTELGLAAEGTKHHFPQGIVDVVNGQAFTVELLLSEFVSLGTDFNTFLNSSNDNFALFRRNNTNQLEFKFAANPGDQRHKIDDGLNLLQNALITVTYEVGGTSSIYVNGEMMAEKPSPSAMGADDLFIGHDSAQKTFQTTYRSMRFYNRALSEIEVKKNYAADADIKNLYVSNGLVSLYSGDNVGSTTGVWEDLVGKYDVPVTIDDKNYFTNGGYHHTAVQNYFPQGIVDVINGQAFTVELRISNLTPVADTFCTLLNSSNDNFALFRRNASDVLEFKFAANAAGSRNTIFDCESLLQDALISITYKVGGESRIYINGVLQSSMSAPSAMGANDFFFGHSQVNRHFEALYRSMRFYNRELTADEVKANARADGYTVPDSDQPTVQNPGYVTVAQPTTKIVGDISMIRHVNTYNELSSLMEAENKPAIAMYTVNSTLDVISDRGVSFSSVSEVLAKTEFKILSAFYVENQAAADALALYLKDIRFYDCLVVSNDPTVIRTFRTALPTVSGVIDFTATYRAESSLSEAQCLEIRRTIKENRGTIALLPAKLCQKSTVQYLYGRQVNVWALASDTPSVTEQYNALLSGAVGVVSDATDALLDIACNKLDDLTMTRSTLNVGHRGIPSKAPENTLEGAILAFELGANVIELDVYLTTDGEVVIMHDGSTGRTCDKDFVVEASSLSQLKQLYVNKGYEDNETFKSCRIPTLKEHLEYFKGKDCNLYIEIKSNNTKIVKACKELVDAYDMYGQCTVITFNEPIAATMCIDWPEMHTGLLCGDIMSGATSEAGLRGAMNVVGKYNATINPSMGGYEAEDIRVALRRGVSIYPWTFRGNLETYKNHFLWGYSGLTGDNADVLGKLPTAVAYTGADAFTVGETLPLSLAVTNYLRETADEKATITILEGDNLVTVGDDSLTFTGAGEVTFLLSYQHIFNRRSYYNLVTQPITVTVTGSESETETESITESESLSESESIAESNDTTESGSDSASVSDSESTADGSGCASVISAVTVAVVTTLLATGLCLRKKEQE